MCWRYVVAYVNKLWIDIYHKYYYMRPIVVFTLKHSLGRPVWYQFAHVDIMIVDTQGPFQYPDCHLRYGDFHYKYKTVVRPSYSYNGNPYTGKTASFYWDAT